MNRWPVCMRLAVALWRRRIVFQDRSEPNDAGDWVASRERQTGSDRKVRA
nr:hypothetical protein [uncultured Acetobacter sp.]